MRKIIFLVLCAFAGALTGVRAQETKLPPDTTKPTEAAMQASEVSDEGKLTVTGYIDSYYLHAFNNPGSGNLMGNQSGAVNGGFPAGRAFDRLTNQFALGLVQTKFIYTNKKSEMVIDLTFGPNAELGNFGNQLGGATSYSPANGNKRVLYGSGIAIKQAYFNYKATSKLTFTVGQFGTHIGYEVIDAPVNYNYSLSNLFNNGPFYHIGAKASYAFSDKLGLMVGIVNNWDAMTDWKRQKSAIAQLFINPVGKWNIYLNYIGGHNDDGFKVPKNAQDPGTLYPLAFGNGQKYNRHLWDITTGWQLTDKFYLGLNAAWGMYTSAGDTATENYFKATSLSLGGKEKKYLPWGGIAFYANYAITDWLGIGARFEHFQDKYQVRYIGATNNSITVTAPITLAAGHLIVKPEFRMDTSPSQWANTSGGAAPVYYYEKGSNGATSKTQTTLGCAFIYKY